MRKVYATCSQNTATSDSRAISGTPGSGQLNTPRPITSAEISATRNRIHKLANALSAASNALNARSMVLSGLGK